MVLHEYSLDAGALTAIAEQFNGVLASHAIILAEAMVSVYLAEKPIVARSRLLESTRRLIYAAGVASPQAPRV